MKASNPKEWASSKPDQLFLCRFHDDLWHVNEFFGKHYFDCREFIRSKRICEIDHYPCDAVVYVPLTSKQALCLKKRDKVNVVKDVIVEDPERT